MGTSWRRFPWRALCAGLVVTAGITLPSAQATNTDGGGSGLALVPIVPCRLLDTRGAEHIGPRSSPLGAADTYNQAVTGVNGQCSIPGEAKAVALNVTTVNGTADSFLTLWPADVAQPLASNLNWQAHDGATPNKVDVKLGADGRMNIYNNSGTVDVIADIVGYYADHNHDDRYYTKAQVDAAVQAAVSQPHVHHDVYNATAIVFAQGGATGNANCIGPGSGFQFMPIVIPLGAKLLSVDVDILDGPSAVQYLLQLVKYTGNPTGNTLSVLTSAAGGAATGSTVRVHHVLVPTTTEVIETGESLEMEPGLPAGSAFCGATVNYELVG
ncbi:MAG: hypothetical protein JWL72_3499 [Ilumatobacteraceae bacterium]|nr:hypothetical protein [Ilumatobacteraceae bacterium]MCU1390161.1 hypothetical protein [Ilumatobacteraceae bacterium]